MLWQRLLTAIVLIPAVVAAVLFSSSQVFAAIAAVVLLVAGDEVARMHVRDRLGLRLLISGGLALLMIAVAFWLPPFAFAPLAAAAALFWLFGTALLLRPGRTPVEAGGGIGLAVPLTLLLLLIAWLSLVSLQQISIDGPLWVLVMLVVIWSADSLAYFSGRRWGRTKLAPTISPGKTREGLYGALAGAVLCGIALPWLGLIPSLTVPAALLLCLATTLVSVGGDLFESLLKRRCGVKDSGNLLPGHGGMYDRIDSLVAAAPVFLVGLLGMGGSA